MNIFRYKKTIIKIVVNLLRRNYIVAKIVRLFLVLCLFSIFLSFNTNILRSFFQIDLYARIFPELKYADLKSKYFVDVGLFCICFLMYTIVLYQDYRIHYHSKKRKILHSILHLFRVTSIIFLFFVYIKVK
jgi:hypothetical protein